MLKTLSRKHIYIYIVAITVPTLFYLFDDFFKWLLNFITLIYLICQKPLRRVTLASLIITFLPYHIFSYIYLQNVTVLSQCTQLNIHKLHKNKFILYYCLDHNAYNWAYWQVVQYLCFSIWHLKKHTGM